MISPTCRRRCSAGIELYRNTARYITVSGIEVSNCAALPSLDSFIDTVMARHGAGINTNGLDFNNAGQQQQPDGIDYEELIRNGAPEGGRSELFQAVVWHLAAKGLSADQIAEELAQYPNGIGAKYAARLLAEVERSFAKWHVEASRKQQERNRELATDPDHPTVPGGDADLRSSLHEVRWPSKGVRAH